MSANFFKIRNGVNVGVLTADPSGGTTGDMYYNSTSNKLREFINGAWRDAVSADDTQTLSNKTLDNTTVETIKDSNLTVQNATDTTKQVKFDASGLTTGTTRTLTVPDASTTLVGTAVTQTLSNKTLDNTTVETIKDSNLTVQNATDTTKQAKFDASGITTGTTRTYGLPDVSSSLLARTSTDTGANRVQNKDLDDSNVEIVNNADNTKKLKISAASISTGTTRTLTAPDATDTIAVLAATQALSSKQISYSTATDSTTTGADATLQAFTTGIVRLTNASLTSVGGIPAGGSGQQLVLENKTGNQIQINNEDAVATAANRIQTGTGAPLSMPNNATVILSYDSTSSRWQLASGSGSGGVGTGKNYLAAVTTSQSTTPNTGNGNFELGSTTGWSLAHSALTSLFPTSVGTGSNPFSSSNGGTAANANLSITASTSSPLSGTYSGVLASTSTSVAGDMLISNAFNIDNSDKTSPLTISFDYSVVSGTFNMSTTSSNSFAVYIYDVTNNAWIQPANVYGMNTTSGVGKLVAVFQSTSNSTQYQLALININSIATSYSLKVDDFSVGPVANNVGLLPLPYTVTIQGAGTSGTYTPPAGTYQIEVECQAGGGGGGQAPATGAGQSSCGGGGGGGGWCKKVINLSTVGATSFSFSVGNGGAVNSGTGGNTTFSGGSVSLTATGGTGGPGGNATGGPTFSSGAGGGGGGASGGDINIPGGQGSPGIVLSAGSQISQGAGGSAFFGIGPQAGENNGTVAPGTGGQTYGAGGSGGAAGPSTAAQNGGTGGAGILIIREYYFGQNVQVSSQAAVNGPVVFFATNSNVGSTLGASSAPTTMTWNASTDNYGGLTTSTTFTVPVTGYYAVNISGTISTPASGSFVGTSTLQLFVNGSGNLSTPAMATTTTGGAQPQPCNVIEGNGVLYTAGTQLSVKLLQNTTSTGFTINSYSFSVVQIQNGQQVLAATPSVNLDYGIPSNLSIVDSSTNVFLDFSSKNFDTHNAVSNAGAGVQTTSGPAWKFTAPVSGKYKIECMVATGSFNINDASFQLYIYKNGSAFGIPSNTNTFAYLTTYSPMVGRVLSLNAGDIIQFVIAQSTGTTQTITSGYVSIFRVGN